MVASLPIPPLVERTRGGSVATLWHTSVSSEAALVRPHLETCVPVWTPYQKGAQDDLEKVPDGFAQSGTR